ncbi:MAG TPA: HlyD family efflux transporter periplasmic adaptor subunit, partial [Afifellaceae bacterium]|nr:HlyD family efflux transporter periplasmic adaptor subunit [Afifellaceae bacterium]
TVSEAALDKAKREARAAEATLDSAEAAISMREAEVANAQSLLIGFDDQGLANAVGARDKNAIPLYSPATGRVLRVIQQSETTLPAGAPIMEIGNIDNDLEIIVELLSTDAVQVSVGDRVNIDDWGGPSTLEGVVERIDPWGFTKVSALGVEEQRVNAVIRFAGDDQARSSLGHGFRVEVRIVVWEKENALSLPSSALFRDGADWAVFRVENGTAKLRRVSVGRNNGLKAEIVDGLAEGDVVVLYPSSGLSDGQSVRRRVLD